jgi:hypothetical protein
MTRASEEDEKLYVEFAHLFAEALGYVQNVVVMVNGIPSVSTVQTRKKLGPHQNNLGP